MLLVAPTRDAAASHGALHARRKYAPGNTCGRQASTGQWAMLKVFENNRFLATACEANRGLCHHFAVIN